MELGAHQNEHVSERYHGLDAARAIALVIGIFHHGIESFISYAKWDWVTQDTQSSVFLDIAFYASHVFRMQAFFLMSGFFAHLILTRKGLKEYIINRSKRLLLPFIIFWPLLYAVTWRLWVWGIQNVKGSTHQEAIAQLPDYMVWSKGFPLMHLWFLYFLILFCTIVVILRPVLSRFDNKSTLRNLCDKSLAYCMQHRGGSLLIGLLMVTPMLGMRDWFGVDTSASGLVPRLAPFVLYGMYFTVGWFLYRQPSLIRNFTSFRFFNLLLSIALIILLVGLNLAFDEPDPSASAMILAMLNFLYSFASATTVFAFLGYAVWYFRSPGKKMRYLSDSAYWGYLIHLPLLALFQIMVAGYDWFWGLKLIVIFVPGILLLFLSYHFWVRKTIIGVLLNGSKKQHALKQKLYYST